MKTCTKCGESKPLTEYYKHNQRKDGLFGFCKSCYKIKRDSSMDKDKRRAYEREYWSRPENKARRAKQVKNSMLKNKERHEAVRAIYLKTDAGLNTQRKSCQVNRCKKQGAYVEHVDPLELYNEQSGLCYICFNEFSFKNMEMDHVIPLSKGGKHQLSNVKMCCARCNKSKGAKIITSEVI